MSRDQLTNLPEGRRTAAGLTSPSRAPGSDPFGEARRAANDLLAAWALRELVALRTSKERDG